MKKVGLIIAIMAVALCASVSSSDAGWKKRGWYMKAPGAACVMRKVTVVGANGRVAVQKIRVCR